MMLAATSETPVLRRLGVLALGLVLVATGVAMMIRGELGVAPYDVLTTGLAEATGLEIGLAAMVLPLLFTLLGWALGRRPGPGTVLAVLLVGPILGLVLRILAERELLAIRIPLFAVGFVLIAAGITAVIVAEIGPGPAEIVMLAIHDRGFPLAPTRTGIEVACVALGWVLGGQIGVGTVIVAVLIGPVLKHMLAFAGYPTAPAPTARGTEPGEHPPADLDEVVDCAAPGA
ncbi:MAG: YczE/YyaS/YitT family protein [Actinomycetota bacterium]